MAALALLPGSDRCLGVQGRHLHWGPHRARARGQTPSRGTQASPLTASLDAETHQGSAGSLPGGLARSSGHWLLVSLPLLDRTTTPPHPHPRHRAFKSKWTHPGIPAPTPLPLRVCSGPENSEDGKYLLPTGEGKYCPKGQAEAPAHRCRRQNVLSVRAPEGQTSWLQPQSPRQEHRRNSSHPTWHCDGETQSRRDGKCGGYNVPGRPWPPQ